MEFEQPAVDEPVWCVGHHIDDPDLELTGAVVDGEISFGVSCFPFQFLIPFLTGG